jgi:hypothetical protein
MSNSEGFRLLCPIVESNNQGRQDRVILEIAPQGQGITVREEMIPIQS